MALSSIVLDFETASACDLKKCGAWRYAEDPTTEILCLSWGRPGAARDPSQGMRGNQRTTWSPYADSMYNVSAFEELRALAEDPSCTFIAFNVQFEKAIWRTIMMPEYGMPNIPNTRWHDIQAACAMRVLPQNLDEAVRALRLPFEKDKDGSRFTTALSKPNARSGALDRSPGSIQRVISYCEDDIGAEDGLHRRVGWLPPGERSVWLLNQRMNERGLRLDMALVGQMQKIVSIASEPLITEFRQLTGFNMTQVGKVKAWCTAQGYPIPNMQKETLAKILGTPLEDDDGDEFVPEAGDDGDDGEGERPAPLPDTVRRALHIRQLIGSASIKKLGRMEACVCGDGRARGLVQYHGTGPGRSAGRLLQPHNFPRGTLDNPPPIEQIVDALMTGDPDYVEMVIGAPAVETVVSSLRHCIISDPERTFVVGDYAGIQARTVLGVAGQHDKCALMAAGADIYCDMATQIYKFPVNKKQHPKERQTGKNSVLGLGFQMGAPKFRFKYAEKETLEFCEEVVRVYRKEWAPKVPFLWYGLQDAAVETVHERTPHEAYGVEYRLEDGWLTARLPSGRKLWYFDPQPIRKAMPWDPTDIRRAFTYKAKKMGVMRTIDAFGGQLAENVVMGIERDIMETAKRKCEKNGFPISLEVHDEIVAEPLKQDADEKAFEQIMLDVDPWVKQIGIPVAVETWVGDRYRK